MRLISAWLYNNECRGHKVFIESTKSRNNWFQWHLPPKCYDPPPTACPGLSVEPIRGQYADSLTNQRPRLWPVAGPRVVVTAIRVTQLDSRDPINSQRSWTLSDQSGDRDSTYWPIRGRQTVRLAPLSPAPYILFEPLMRPEHPANARNQCFVLTVNSWP